MATTRKCWCVINCQSILSVASGGLFETDILDLRSGIAVLRITGTGAISAFSEEAGGHRWKRIPPNEKRGRVQTSTITVAILPEPTQAQFSINPKDLHWQTCRASGAGEQNVNKVETAVQLTYIPTGLMVRSETERSQYRNRELALALLTSRLWNAECERVASELAANHKSQIGSGMRGDKRRTIRERDDQVNDHVTGQRWTYRDYARGNW